MLRFAVPLWRIGEESRHHSVLFRGRVKLLASSLVRGFLPVVVGSHFGFIFSQYGSWRWSIAVVCEVERRKKLEKAACFSRARKGALEKNPGPFTVGGKMQMVVVKGNKHNKS